MGFVLKISKMIYINNIKIMDVINWISTIILFFWFDFLIDYLAMHNELVIIAL